MESLPSSNRAREVMPIIIDLSLSFPFFSRMLERIVPDQMYDYLRSRGILTISQSAFQKFCSTATSLINSTEFWCENIDHKKVDLAIFLDLKKAFDTVNHEILLEKLEAYGI